jgi:hypothetical protein
VRAYGRAVPRSDLRTLAVAVCLSALGDLLALVALGLHVHALTGSALAVSALLAATTVPSAALAPLAGRLADRVESVRLIAAASLVQAAVAAGLALTDSLPAILALTVLLAAGTTVSAPAEFALVPAVAGGGDVAPANGVLEAARSLGCALGPVLAAVAVTAGGARLALLADAAAFLAVVAATARLRVRRPAPRDGAGRARARGGAHAILADGVLRPVIGGATVALLLLSGAMTIVLVVAVEELRVGEAGYGLLVAVWMAGMIAGGVASRRVPPALLAIGATVALAVQSLSFALQAAWLVLPVAIAAHLVGGAGHGVKNALLRTLLHARIPAALHGRAFAAYNGARNAAELTALAIGGVLVELAGARPALLVAGLGPLAVALCVLGTLRAGRMTGRASAQPGRRVAALIPMRR